MKALAVLYIFLQVVKPTIEKGRNLDFQIFNLFASDYVTDPELITALADLHDKYIFWLQHKDSIVRWHYVDDCFRAVTRRLLDLAYNQDCLALNKPENIKMP